MSRVHTRWLTAVLALILGAFMVAVIVLIGAAYLMESAQ